MQTLGTLYNYKQLFGSILHLSHAYIALIASLSHLLASIEEVSSFSGILLHYGCEAYLTFEEVLEALPLRLLRVECEGVLALSLECGVEAPEVPVAACYGSSLLGLCFTHTLLQAVVDTGSVSDDD